MPGVGPAYLDGATLSGLVGGDEAVDVLERALGPGGVDPESDGPRLSVPVRDGELLVMPAGAPGYAGVKAVSVAPQNAAAGHPTVQGLYVLFGGERLAPLAVLDAAELTLIRTPATTALAVRHLLAARPGGPQPGGPEQPDGTPRVGRLLVLGTGPQAERHLRLLTAMLSPTEVVVVGRRPAAVAELVRRCARDQITVRAGSPVDVGGADVVVCATSSRVPVLDDALVGPDAVVCAVGSHGADRWELPPALVRRADVVVEGRASALREGGNLLAARTAQEWGTMELGNLADLVAGHVLRHPGRPAVYSGVGMAWEDLAVACHLYEKHTRTEPQP